MVTYTYDLADRLINQHLPGGGNDDFGFTLDALGRPLTRSHEGGGSDVYAYVGLGETAWYTDPAATNAVTSALGPDESRLAVTDAASFAWLLPDLHGNVAAGVNLAETTVSHGWRYDGYGRTVTGSSTSALNPWKYQGRLDVSPDSANPLYDAGARFYDPNLGAFTQLDSYAGSAQDPLSLNRYLYAHANPSTLIDPTGHAAMASETGSADKYDRKASNRWWANRMKQRALAASRIQKIP